MTLPAGSPFETIVCEVRVTCELPPMSAGVKDHYKAASVEHKVSNDHSLSCGKLTI